VRTVVFAAAVALIAAAPATSEPARTATSPTAEIVTRPPPFTAATTASFAFDSSDGGVDFFCSLDGSTYSSCTSPASYDSLADGSHTFAVEAADGSGQRGDAASYDWTVDTVAPTARLVSTPPVSATSGYASFGFGANEPDVSFTCSLDGGPASLCVSPQAYSALALGQHTFAVTPIDPAGNVGGSASYAWSVVAPSVNVPPVSGFRARVRYRSIKLTWSAPRQADFDHVVVLRTFGADASSVPVYAGAATTFVDSAVNNGKMYRYLIISFDHAGNASSTVRLTVTPDRLLAKPANGSVIADRVQFAWARVTGATLYNVQLYRDGKKVLSAWPKKTHFKLARHWRFGGHSHSLVRGQYLWYVWPGFGRGARARYGPPLGQSAFTAGG
jgi:hypothetical protein